MSPANLPPSSNTDDAIRLPAVANAKEALQKIPNREAAWLKANLDFYHGDHWQRGDGWTGPVLPQTHAKYSDSLTLLEKIFVSRNSIAQVTDQHTAGVLGQPPRWTVAGDDEALAAEARELLAGWLADQQGMAQRAFGGGQKLCTPLEALNLAARSSLLATRGGLRFYVANQERATTPEEAIRRIFIQNPDPRQTAVFVDQETMTAVGVYVYTEDGRAKAELSYLDGEYTVLLILDENGIETGALLPLGRRLTIYEMERPLFITEQIRAAQKALNKAETMASKNLDVGGFLERVFLNAQPPGVWEKNEATGLEEFKPTPLEIGPGMSTFLSGIEESRADGSRSYTTPAALFREPTKPQAFTDTADHYHAAILEQAGQLHTLLANEGSVSSESRSQARDSFSKSLLITKPEVDRALVWLLESTLALTAVLHGKPGRYEGLAIAADCQLDLGIQTSDEIQKTTLARGSGLLSRQTAMVRIGVADPQAEAALIDGEAGGEAADDGA